MATAVVFSSDEMLERGFVSVQTYLESSYQPDVDYLDGFLEERNVGEWDHARIQAVLIGIFFQHEAEWGVQVAPEARLQVGATRYRVPDLMVLRAEDVGDAIVTRPPLLCVEVLSQRDTFRSMERRIEEYIRMGVANVWAIDPASREIFVYGGGQRQWLEVPELVIEGTPVRIRVEQIFAALPKPKTFAERD